MGLADEIEMRLHTPRNEHVPLFHGNLVSLFAEHEFRHRWEATGQVLLTEDSLQALAPYEEIALLMAWVTERFGSVVISHHVNTSWTVTASVGQDRSDVVYGQGDDLLGALRQATQFLRRSGDGEQGDR